MPSITIILLNLRFSDFYSKDLFKQIKAEHDVRFVAVLDQHFIDRVGTHILPFIDEVHLLKAKDKDGFLSEFCFDELCKIVDKELSSASEIKIVCTDEFNLLHAGHLRRKYHLSGNTDVDLIAFRDKEKMKSILQKAGVRVPHFKILESADNFESLSNIIGLPFVIKPVDSCGSFGVYIIQCEADYCQAIDEIKRSSATFEVEEFIEGKLYHVDSLMCDGEIRFICANEYSCPNDEFAKGKILGSIFLDESSELSLALTDFAGKALSALGSKNLVNHMEIFVTNYNELVFLEVSARPPGALINVVYPVNHMINLMDEDFFIQSGLHVELPRLETARHAFWAMFPLAAGRINQLHQPIVNSDCDITYFRKVGDIISKDECQSIVGKMAHAIFYHEDKEVLRQDFESLRSFKLAEIVG